MSLFYLKYFLEYVDSLFSLLCYLFLHIQSGTGFCSGEEVLHLDKLQKNGRILNVVEELSLS